MIFGTYKLHKATNGMLPILCQWMGTTLGGATCSHVYVSYWRGIFRESRSTTLTNKTVSW